MSASLIESLQGLVTPALLKTATSTLGESEGALTKGLGAIVSKILSALVSGAGDTSLMNTIAGLVVSQSRDPGALMDVAGLLTSGTASTPGNQLLGALFGVKEGGVAQAAATAAGLRPQSGAALLGLAGPLVLAGLGKSAGASASSLTGAALSGLLNSQRAALLGNLAPAAQGAAAAMQQTATAVSSAPVQAVKQAVEAVAPAAAAAPAVPAAASAARTTAASAAQTAAAAAQSGGAGLTWLFWLIPLLLLAGIGYVLWETKYSELKSQPSTPVEKKAEAKPEKKAEAPAAAPAPAPSAAPAAAPDANGLVELALPGGGSIKASATGVESKLIAFLQDANSVIDKKTWFDFDRLNFQTGDTALTSESLDQISNITAIMKAFPSASLKIGGYTDNVGKPEDNLKLSTERARVVLIALVAQGIPESRLESEGYGEQHPIASNDTPEGRNQNRRTALSVRAR